MSNLQLFIFGTFLTVLVGFVIGALVFAAVTDSRAIERVQSQRQADIHVPR